ncbi:MAG: hypothetical protein ABFC31_00100 [Clostridiaceae bacterium]
MMKRAAILLFSLLFALLSLSACASSPTTDVVYRGEVTAVNEDGSFEVTQLSGHNYGQTSIVFRTDDSVLSSLDVPLAEGAFVEVHYSGVLTRSLPPQGTATSITQIASFSDGIIQNGTIQSVTQGKDGWTINILPLGVEATGTDADYMNEIVLQVPAYALEGLTSDDIKVGAVVSAVTSGIATASLPPQMPVVVLLPYSE